ncbi:glycosyltransferase family 2 protein [Streptococcus parasuis]|uniref:glycosyltransferase family 2 protein n=1 Tax=Streptococcus parasuis TaxID=1501662 RepID=UPI002896D098|nr:glycosyltransferase family 2 protein [Streptococcus parasuis]
MERITIFTPTYNRAYTLDKCYSSLVRQTCKDFEWLIIDDGSTDNTAELVTRWQKENIISIRYIYKKNGGMHSGYNVAYENIFSELSICVDSDDYLLDNAIERILTFWDHNKTDGIAGIVALNVTKDGKVIGNNLPNLKSIKIYDYYNRLKGKGDKKMIYRPEVIRPYTSPEFENERLFPTAYKYFNVDLNYDMLVLNEPLCVVEYMPDGFTKNIIKHYKKNLNSYIYYRRFIMEYPNSTFKHKYNSAVHYIAECLLAKRKKWFKDSPNKLVVITAIPLGYLLYLYILIKG